MEISAESCKTAAGKIFKDFFNGSIDLCTEKP